MSVSPADIRTAEVFGALTEIQREEIALGGYIAMRDKGEYVCRAGDAADFLYVLIEGRVGLYADAHDGMLYPINIVTSGQAVGLSAFFPAASWSLTARCLSDAKLLVIPRRWLLSHMAGDPDLELRVLQGVSELQRRQLNELASAIADTQPSDDFALPLSQRALASSNS